jgi:broad specificity phosphatase PhoE
MMKRPLLPALAAAVLATLPAAASAQQLIILVRHAELQAAAMAGPKQVALSQAGATRAERLAGMLKDAGIDAIYVTDFVRTQKTAEPLAHELKEQPTVLPKGDPRELVARLRKEHANQKVLLVGHTDTLPGLLKALGHPANVKIDSADYGNVFVVIPKGDAPPVFARLRY